MNRRIRSIEPTLTLWRIAYLKWARREIHPLHGDLPGIVLALNNLEHPLYHQRAAGVRAALGD